MTLSWWLWVLPDFSGCFLFGKSAHIWSWHPFVVLSTLLSPYTDPLDWVPFGGLLCLLVVLRIPWSCLLFCVLLCTQCTCGPQWSWAHHCHPDIRSVDLSACWPSLRTPDDLKVFGGSKSSLVILIVSCFCLVLHYIVLSFWYKCGSLELFIVVWVSRSTTEHLVIVIEPWWSSGHQWCSS